MSLLLVQIIFLIEILTQLFYQALKGKIVNFITPNWQFKQTLLISQYPYPVRVPASIAALGKDGSLLTRTTLSVPKHSSTTSFTPLNTPLRDTTAESVDGAKIGKSIVPQVSTRAGKSLNSKSFFEGLKKMMMLNKMCPKCMLPHWQKIIQLWYLTQSQIVNKM